jgi:GT2 family glycosyltransferase
VLHPDACAGGIAVLDGVLLAARRQVFQHIPFDAHTFDGFHGYDVDWSVRAARAGYRLCAAGDLEVVHASRGRYDATWHVYAERFCAKHSIRPAEPAPPPYYETRLASAAHVVRFFEQLIACRAT